MILPAISYSPETKFTFGGAVIHTFDLNKGMGSARKSNIKLLCVYTTAKQFLVESRWEILTKDELFFLKGRAFYHKYPDRNYGLGNAAEALVEEHYFDENLIETNNYINFSSKRLHFAATVARKMTRSLYIGIDYELESLFDYKLKSDSIFVRTPELFQNRITGTRSGLGWNLTYDTRDNLISAYKGQYLAISNRYYHRWIGSDFDYGHLKIDYRLFVNTIKNQVFAVNLLLENRFTDSPESIHFRGLARMGGADYVKGYFYGTYQDKHLFAFQTEYRMPIFKLNRFPIVKGVGIVLMFNGGHVYRKLTDIQFNTIRTSIGGGFRFLVKEDERIHTGIDFSLGLHKTADLDTRQYGIYFFLGETF